MNKTLYRYTTFVAEVKASAASNDIYQKCHSRKIWQFFHVLMFYICKSILMRFAQN